MEKVSLEEYNGNGNNRNTESGVNEEDNEYFWLPKKKDIYCWLANAFSMFAIYFYMKRQNSLYNLLYFQDVPHEIIYAKHHSNKQKSAIITDNYPYFKVHPLFMSFFMSIFGSRYKTIIITSTVLASMTSVYLFRRFLISYNCVRNSLFSTLIFCFFPIFSLAFKINATSDNLFLCFALASLILFNQSSLLCIPITLLACLTRSEGVFLLISFLFLRLKNINFVQDRESLKNETKIQKQRKNRKTIAIIIVTYNLALIYYIYMYSTYGISFFTKSFSLSKDIKNSSSSFNILSSFLTSNFNIIGNLRELHGMFVYYGLFFFAICGLISRGQLRLAGVAICWFIPILFMKGDFSIRVGLPLFTISCIVGFDSLFVTKYSQTLTIAFFVLIYLPVSVLYSANYSRKVDTRSLNLVKFY